MLIVDGSGLGISGRCTSGRCDIGWRCVDLNNCGARCIDRGDHSDIDGHATGTRSRTHLIGRAASTRWRSPANHDQQHEHLGVYLAYLYER